MDKIAVLIPCYNEGLTIKKVVEDWKKALPGATVYVYDNNSTDDTVSAATEAGAIVRFEPMQGKGNVIRRMFREIDAECYIMVDGDDTYPAEAGLMMAKDVLDNQVDMVIGDRLSSTYYQENKRPFHNVGNSITKWFINSAFNTDIKDVMTGLRAFSYRFVKSFPVLSKGFEIETEMTIHAIDKNMHVTNMVVDYRDRPEGSVSKLNTIPDGIKVIKTIINLYKNYKPFHFFGVVTLLLMVFAFVLFIPVLMEYLNTGLVLRFPTLIVSGFIMLSALLALSAGMILETLIHKDRQAFEFRLQLVETMYREKIDRDK